MAVGLFRGVRRRRDGADAARPAVSGTATGTGTPVALLEHAFRPPLSTVDTMRANGDSTPFVAVTCHLRQGGRAVAVELVASEIAVHIVEHDRDSAGVST